MKAAVKRRRLLAVETRALRNTQVCKQSAQELHKERKRMLIRGC